MPIIRKLHLSFIEHVGSCLTTCQLIVGSTLRRIEPGTRVASILLWNIANKIRKKYVYYLCTWYLYSLLNKTTSYLEIYSLYSRSIPVVQHFTIPKTFYVTSIRWLLRRSFPYWPHVFLMKKVTYICLISQQILKIRMHCGKLEPVLHSD